MHEPGDLCRHCGLCCDGSLFGLVPLEPPEVAGARRRRLRVVSSEKGFLQPCGALTARSDGQRECSMYDERPASCRRFVCRLLSRYEAGAPLDPCIAAVRRVRAVLSLLAEIGFSPRDRSEPSGDARGARFYAELVARLEEDFARA